MVGNVLNDTIFGGIFVESSSSLTVNGVFNSRGPLEGDFSGEINLNGEIRPGGSQIGGIFFPGDLNFSADSDLEITLAGEAHDAIGGNVRLLGGSLTLVFTVGNVPPVGTEFEICQGVESGQFGGLPDGAVVSAALGRQYVINYVDGSVFLTAEELLLGDVNGDGLLNLLDVAPFVELLASGNYLGAADVNMDGSVNLLDVTGFVELLAG